MADFVIDDWNFYLFLSFPLFLVKVQVHAKKIVFFFQIMANLGAADVDSRLEEQLIDGILYAFQEQTNEVVSFM